MSTVQIFQPRGVASQVGILLLHSPAHLFVGEPVELLARQTAVSHLEENHRKFESFTATIGLGLTLSPWVLTGAAVEDKREQRNAQSA